MDKSKKNRDAGLQNSTISDKKPDYLDHRIAELTITEPGLSEADIGKRLGISRATVSHRRCHGGAKSLIEETLVISREKLTEIALRALRALDRHINSPDPRISIAAAGLILRSMDSLMNQADHTEKVTSIERIYVAEWGSSTSA